MRVDARGLGCPKPVIMAEEALARMEEGIVDVLIDNEASVSNLRRFAAKNGYYSETFRTDSHWNVKIVKGYPCEVPPGEAVDVAQATSAVTSEVAHQEPEKDILMVVGSDAIGKEETLGKILMKSLFDTMKVTKELPHTIFFLNAGVKLTTIDEEMAAILKDFENMGVEIFSCGTCLKHYNLESSLKVGYRGSSSIIVEGMKDFKKTVWIG
ncbi:MAG: sulfurtransferase-like selenium metabolism protein YedF [Chloroflexota bacterium]